MSNSVGSLQQRVGVVLRRGQVQSQPGCTRTSSSTEPEVAEKREVLTDMLCDLERAQEAIADTLPLIHRELQLEPLQWEVSRGDTGAAPDDEPSSTSRPYASSEAEEPKGLRKSIGPPIKAQRGKTPGKTRLVSSPKASPAASNRVGVCCSPTPPAADAAAFSARSGSEGAASVAKALSTSRRQSPRQSTPKPGDSSGVSEDASFHSPGTKEPWRPAPWVPAGPIPSTVSRSRSTTQLSEAAAR